MAAIRVSDSLPGAGGGGKTWRVRTPTLRRKTVLASALAGFTAAVAGCSEPDSSPADDRRVPPRSGRQEYVAGKLASMSLEDKVGQLFMVYVSGAAADTGDPEHVASNQERLGVANGAELIQRYRPGGIVYFGWAGNVDDPAQIAALSNGLREAAADGVPPLIGADQEYGVVTRIGEPATQFPGGMPLGATGDAEAAENAARMAGIELRAMGLNQNFAPVADVNVDPANPVIGVRSFSSDPGLAAELTAAQVRGYAAGGVASCAKHFPGHGDTDVDSHVGLPVITHSEREWARIDAPPFEAAIEAGAEMIMSAHIQFPALDDSLRPATLSEPILTGLLRDRLGFTGVIVTDSLEMEGVRSQYSDERVPVAALQAGADLLLMPPDFRLARQAVLDAVVSGELTEERLDASVERLLGLKYGLGLVEDSGPGKGLEVVGAEEHRAAAADISDRAITLLGNDGTLPAPVEGRNVLVTGWGENTTRTVADALRSLGASAEALPTGDEPDSGAIAAAVAAAADRDLIVVATFQVGADSPQVDLVRSLQGTGVPVVAAAVGTPYDIAHFSDVNACLASYSYTAGSLESLVKVIAGEVEPQGSLPVEVPAAGDGGEVLFEFGSGQGF